MKTFIKIILWTVLYFIPKAFLFTAVFAGIETFIGKGFTSFIITCLIIIPFAFRQYNWTVKTVDRFVNDNKTKQKHEL